MSDVSSVLIFGGLAGIISLMGLLLIKFLEKFIQKNTTYLIVFAAGILLTAAIPYILTEVIELNMEGGLVAILVAFVAMFTIEHLTRMHDSHHHHHIHPEKIKGGSPALVGIAFHSAIGGIGIGAGFEIDASIGIIATFGILFHKFFDGTTIMSILIHFGYGRKQRILYSALLLLATPIAAIGTFFFATGLDHLTVGILLGAATGAFIYVAASDLVPEAHMRHDKFNAVFFILGVALMFIFGVFFSV